MGRETALDETRRAFPHVISLKPRTPLNSIIGFSEIIVGEPHGPLGAPRRREYARGDMTHGTGLGLPIARLLAEGMGRRIALASSPGEEVAATVTLRPA